MTPIPAGTNSSAAGLTGASGNTSSATSSSAGTGGADPLASESTFLTLLVSQLQNQDPLNPVDSTQFVGQLTAYSQLEQLIGIHANTTALAGQASASSTASQPTTSAATGGQTSSVTQTA